LPSLDKLGAIDQSAYDFVDFLAAAGQSLWQVLPLNPVGFGESPYQCPSAFAGNPLLIDLTRLSLTGPDFANQPAAFAAARIWKENELRRLFAQQIDNWQDENYVRFCEQQHFWLTDYCLFMALRQKYGVPWSTWPKSVRQRNKTALRQLTHELQNEIKFQTFLQYSFFSQWQELRKYAAKQHISLVGDMPLYVAYDSADVWSHRELFDLDKTGQPNNVAGVPPDYFSSTGQLWRNPLYDWSAHRLEDYHWWRARLGTLLTLVDKVRLDHFRGLEAYYAIPSSAATAEKGQWIIAPGTLLLTALQREFKPLPLLAEDLGYITPAVTALKDQFHLPGMQVLHFCFYDTLAGQAGEICLQHYIGEVSEENIAEKLIEFAYAAHGSTVIIPAQDLLGLDERYRMNMPGTVGGNWRFRLAPGQLNAQISVKLNKLSAKYNRKISL